MLITQELKSNVLSINNEQSFTNVAFKLFDLHKNHNPIYQKFIQSLPSRFHNPAKIDAIPFLPIDFYKSHDVGILGLEIKEVFTSSGTSSSTPSRNLVPDLNWYLEICLQNFNLFYGDIKDYCILALLPSYLERDGSSLVVMANMLIEQSANSNSGFYLNELDLLKQNLEEAQNKGQKTILLGVSFALLDFTDKYHINFPELIVMETGGMKGKRKELIRNELHDYLKRGFGVSKVHSEYGMTELFSQAYSKGDGKFGTPPWMKVLIRDANDPFELIANNQTGGINVIDLSNLYSCPFIATQDLGKISGNKIEILGRFDNSDIRGCNLLAL
jgi:hypothetical protein